MRRSSCLTPSLQSGARSGCVLPFAHFAASIYTLHDACVVALRGFSASTSPAFRSHGFGCVQQEQRSKSERASLRKAEAAIAARLAAAQEQWLQEKEDLNRSLQESRWGLRERQTGARLTTPLATGSLRLCRGHTARGPRNACRVHGTACTRSATQKPGCPVCGG